MWCAVALEDQQALQSSKTQSTAASDCRLDLWACRVLLAAVLVLSACSSGDKGSGSTTTGSPEPGDSAQAAVDSAQGDSAQAAVDSAQGDSAQGDSAHTSGDTAEGICERPISEEDLSVYRGYFPDAECGSQVAMPEPHLTSEDVELGNLDVVVFSGSDGAVLGHARRVFTPVYCTADVCEAIVFVLVFQADTTFLDIFHPDGVLFDLKKYWEDRYLTFSDEDMDLLRAQLADPPAVLLSAPDTDALVEGTHGTAPTLVEYQPYVVRGAAFTCYIILQYSVNTQTALEEILASLGSGGAR